MVLREVVEDDRRAARLSLTPQAKRVLATIRKQRDVWLAARMAELSPRQLADLQRGIDAIEQMIERREEAAPEAGR